MTEEQLDRLGRLADTLENILHGTKIPMGAEFHLNMMKLSVRVTRDDLANLYREISGEDPWETNPFDG